MKFTIITPSILPVERHEKQGLFIRVGKSRTSLTPKLLELLEVEIGDRIVIVQHPKKTDLMYIAKAPDIDGFLLCKNKSGKGALISSSRLFRLMCQLESLDKDEYISLPYEVSEKGEEKAGMILYPITYLSGEEEETGEIDEELRANFKEKLNEFNPKEAKRKRRTKAEMQELRAKGEAPKSYTKKTTKPRELEEDEEFIPGSMGDDMIDAIVSRED